jgi:hypothetical protein
MRRKHRQEAMAIPRGQAVLAADECHTSDNTEIARELIADRTYRTDRLLLRQGSRDPLFELFGR